MAKYIDENVAQAIANDIQKNRVLLGAFDTVDTSNADYNLIHRNGWRVDLGKFTFYEHGSVQHLFTASLVLTNAKLPQDNNTIANILCSLYSAYYWNQVESKNLQIALSSDGSIRIYDESCNSADDLMAKINGIILQFELADNLKYTEKVIKGVPILNLDQSGANWLRSEWEKCLNLLNPNLKESSVSFSNNVFSFSSYQSMRVFSGIELSAGTYTIQLLASGSLSYAHSFELRTTSGDTVIASINNIQTDVGSLKTATFTLTQRTSLYLIQFETGSETINIQVQIIEGDHAYPYQPYNGAIVHEKDLEPVLLWANGSPNSGFSSNVLTINDLPKYKYIIIEYKYYYVWKCLETIKFLVEPQSSQYAGVLSHTNERFNEQASRTFNIETSTNLTFDDGYLNGSANNEFIIPVAIYGTNIL